MKFNYEPLYNIEIESKEDGVNVHFDRDTLGINLTDDGSGYSLTPDWNDTHFTLGLSEDSVLYHVTQEGVKEGERTGEGDLQPGEFIADVYSALRALGPVLPVERLEVEEVGKPDFEAIESYLRDKGVVRDSGVDITIDRGNLEGLITAISNDPKLKFELYERVLNPISISDLEDSGENIFVVPGIEDLHLLFLFSDGYVAVVDIRDLHLVLQLLSGLRGDENGFGGGSRVIYFLSRALASSNPG